LNQLSNAELWDRVHALESRIVPSPTGVSKSLVTRVGDDRIMRVSAEKPGGRSRPTLRSQVYQVYEHLFVQEPHRGIVQRDLNALLGRPETRNYNGRFTFAILMAAAPDQIEPFTDIKGFSGIRLR